jgi:hypothetical protein
VQPILQASVGLTLLGEPATVAAGAGDNACVGGSIETHSAGCVPAEAPESDIASVEVVTGGTAPAPLPGPRTISLGI